MEIRHRQHAAVDHHAPPADAGAHQADLVRGAFVEPRDHSATTIARTTMRRMIQSQCAHGVGLRYDTARAFRTGCCDDMPPSAGILVPRIQPVRSDSRKATTGAMIVRRAGAVHDAGVFLGARAQRLQEIAQDRRVDRAGADRVHADAPVAPGPAVLHRPGDQRLLARRNSCARPSLVIVLRTKSATSSKSQRLRWRWIALDRPAPAEARPARRG